MRPLEPSWEVEAEVWPLSHRQGGLAALRLMSSAKQCVMLLSSSHFNQEASQRYHEGCGYKATERKESQGGRGQSVLNRQREQPAP